MCKQMDIAHIEIDDGLRVLDKALLENIKNKTTHDVEQSLFLKIEWRIYNTTSPIHFIVEETLR